MSFTSLPSAGSALRASVLAKLITELRPITVIKNTNTSRTANTLLDDPELTVPLAANSIYAWQASIIAVSNANNAGDIRISLSFPTGSEISYAGHGLADSLTSGASGSVSAAAENGTTGTLGPFTYGLSTSETGILIWGWVDTASDPGSLTVQWGQASTNASASTVLNGSSLEARLIG